MNRLAEEIVLVGEGHHRRGGAGSFRVGDDRRLAALHRGDHRVGRAQVDTDRLGHATLLSARSRLVAKEME
jgi:hypothetical protein